MTTKGPKNNLSSHLAWLIREKPTIPPPRAEKPPSAQAISSATLAAIESQTRLNSAAGSSGTGTGVVASLSRANSTTTAAVSQNRDTSQQKHIPLSGKADSFGHDPGGESSSRPATHVHHVSQITAPAQRGSTSSSMPVLQLAKTPSNRRRLTSIQKKQPQLDEEEEEEDPYVPVPRTNALPRNHSTINQQQQPSDSEDGSDPYEPVARKMASQNKSTGPKRNGSSLLDKYTQHCADGKGTKTPAATKKVVLPTGPVESIDLTMSDDEDIPNLPTSRFKPELSTRSATVTPSRKVAPERVALPIGPSDPPPPYSSQEPSVGRPLFVQSLNDQLPSLTKSSKGEEEEPEEAEGNITTAHKSAGTKRRPLSGEPQGNETPKIQATKAAMQAQVPSDDKGVAAVQTARKSRTIVFDSDDDGDADLSDHSVTIGRGSVAGDNNPAFNVDLHMQRSVSVPEIERRRAISALKSPSPARALSGSHRDNSPKVSFDDTVVFKSSPFHRSPSRTKRMNQRNATPDPKELAKNLARILSPVTGKENIQSPLREATALSPFDLRSSLRKQDIEKEMAEINVMIHAYTSNEYKGSMTLVQMAMKFEELKGKLASLENRPSGVLSEAHDDRPRASEHVAVDVYATQHAFEDIPPRKTFLARLVEEPTQFIKQTQYPVGSKLSDELSDERVSATILPSKELDTMDVDDDEIEEGENTENNPFNMRISSPPDAEYTAPTSPAQRFLDKGKGRAREDGTGGVPNDLDDLGSDDIPDEFFDFENEIQDEAQENEQEHSGSGDKAFNIEDLDEDDFELSPEDLAEIEGLPLDQRARSPSSDIELLDQPPPNIFEARAKHVSQFAKDHDNLDVDDVELAELDDDIMEIGTQKAVEVDMGAPSMTHPWSNDVARALKSTFKLKGFRANQLEAINATLAGNDVFVLMPTGGGKSLCYQLPAVVSSGRTRGVTFVISPLLSLMEDQVAHLQALNIKAYMFNSSITKEERREILKELKSSDAATSIQLLYVTPEMLASSKIMESAMDSLHKRRLIARVVIDEAHCVSQWGHDFRKDYKNLGGLRSRLQGVPFMALTATATPQVQTDTMHNLSIKKCKIFKQSFNRPNLSYEVRKKGKEAQTIQDIIGIVQSPKYQGKCGIVYCLSKKDCERVAGLLYKAGVKANFYHAGLQPDERKVVQQQWQNGQLKVIVATIAFGMGIDKPDVRFVIHHSLPKSLEGYYQETGRAGRDGKLSGCYLFYSVGDIMRILKMIDTGEGATEQTIAHGKTMVRAVQNFCENRAECRRMLVLSYFAEKFKPEDCKKTCDNCRSGIEYTPRDVTEEAKAVLSIVANAEGKSLSAVNIADIFKGSRAKTITGNDWDKLKGHGVGSSWGKDDCARLVENMIAKDIICQSYVTNRSGFTNTYIITGPKANKLRDGSIKLQMIFDHSPTKKAGKSQTTNDQYFESTNVSSPIPPTKIRSRKAPAPQNTQPDDDGFMPIRDGGSGATGRKRKSDGIVDETAAPRRKKVAAQPIGMAADNIRAGLNEYDLDVLERFLKDAKRIRGDLMNERSLRVESVFTDTELSWMGVKLPCSMTELMAIPQLQDKERIRLYGSKFLPVTQKYSNEKLENYEGTQFIQSGETQTHLPGVDGFLEEDFDEDYEDEEDGEESHYFSNTAGASQAASNFSARMAAASQTKSVATTKAVSRAPKRPSTGGGRGRGGKKFFKRASGGTGKASRGGKASTRGNTKGGRGGYGGPGSTGIRPMI